MRVGESTKSPIWWLGGKGRLVDWILGYFPPHKRYLEAFGGGAAVLLSKRQAEVEIYNDLDSSLVNFFRVLRDQTKFEKLRWGLENTPFSRELYIEAKGKVACENPAANYEDDVLWARDFYTSSRQAMSGIIGNSWGKTFKSSDHGMAACCSRWFVSLTKLGRFASRMRQVIIENRNAVELVRSEDDFDLLIYCDPPYLGSTRKSGKYCHEMSPEDHTLLLNALIECKAMVVLSSYPNNLYESALHEAGWIKEEKQLVCQAAARVRHSGLTGSGHAKEKQMRTEVLWRNRAAVDALEQTKGAQLGLYEGATRRNV